MSQDWDGGLTGGMGGPIARDFQFKKSSQEPQNYTVHPLFLKAPGSHFPSPQMSRLTFYFSFYTGAGFSVFCCGSCDYIGIVSSRVHQLQMG